MIHSKRKNRLGKVIAAAGLAVVFIAAPIAASAATSTIGASNESYNQTIYYSATRYHAGGSGASFNLQSHSGMCGSTFWLALRIPGGDSTLRNSFTSVGGTQSFKWWNGALSVPAGWYATTARNDCAGMPGALYSWSGSLHLN